MSEPTPRDLLQNGGVLVPKLWPRAAHELELLDAQLSGSPPWPRESVPLGDHLLLGVAELVRDGEVGASYELQPSAAGIPFELALSAAVDDLRRLDGEALAPVDDGVLSGPWQDGAGAARITLVERFLGAQVRGAPVVFLPTPDLLLVTGSEDARGIGNAVEMAFEAFENDTHPLSGVPLILSNEGVWSTWKPPVSHPAYAMLMLLRTNDWMCHYPSQGDLLVRLGLRAAPIEIDESTGAPSSEWPSDGPMLLPATGLVRLGRSGVVVRWESVEHLLGRYLERTEHYPPRFRTTGFPTPAELAAVQQFDASY